MSRIIAAMDNSATAQRVLAAAGSVAPVLGATVECVHVSDVPGRTAASTAASAGVPFRAMPGDPLSQLVALGEDDDVVGFAIGQRSHVGTGATGHLALGLADAVDKPVLVVPPEATVAPTVHRVLIAMEGAPGRARALKRAVALVAAADLDLVVVHVDDEASIPSFSDQVQYEAEAYAAEFLARYAPGAPDLRLELRIGVPAEQILATCETVRPDVVAMGWPHAEQPSAVVRAVLERSPVPVLLVALL